MMENATGEKKKKSPTLLIVTLAVLISAISSFFLGQSGILRLRELEAEYDRIRMENYKLALENKKTAEEIRRLKTDPVIIEKIAREELHLVSPHDVVLVVPEQEPENAVSDKSDQ